MRPAAPRHPLRFDAVMVLGKELRRRPERALRELRARSAAASAALRHGVGAVVSLEAPLAGQDEAGSAIVARMLGELDVPAGRMVLACRTRSTREEAWEAQRLVEARGWARLLVVTAAYHVPRARRYFEDHLGPGRVAVHAPGALLRYAHGLERTWIEAGAVDDDAFRDELGIETLFSGLARVLAPLPGPLRWTIEVRAGDLLRGAGDAAALSAPPPVRPSWTPPAPPGGPAPGAGAR